MRAYVPTKTGSPCRLPGPAHFPTAVTACTVALSSVAPAQHTVRDASSELVLGQLIYICPLCSGGAQHDNASTDKHIGLQRFHLH